MRVLHFSAFIESALEKSTNFFKYAILPELLCKYYTTLPTKAYNSVTVVEQHGGQEPLVLLPEGRVWSNNQSWGKHICVNQADFNKNVIMKN